MQGLLFALSEHRLHVFPSLCVWKCFLPFTSGEMWPLLAIHRRTHSVRRHHCGNDLRERAGWLGLSTFPDQLCKSRSTSSGAVLMLREPPGVRRPTHHHTRSWALRTLKHCYLQEKNPLSLCLCPMSLRTVWMKWLATQSWGDAKNDYTVPSQISPGH